jgi:predicted Zn-dependent peptidase
MKGALGDPDLRARGDGGRPGGDRSRGAADGVTRERLDNGLSIVVAPMPHLHRAVATLFLRVGSRFEAKADNGISHFLEHMVFRGTRTFETAHAQALAFERLGATLYAATHVDHGVMSVTVPPPNLARVLELLAEVASAPRFSDIEVERGIVREEILEDLDEDDRLVDADGLVRALAYEGHPLGFPITGDLATLERFDGPGLARHHAKHYTGHNAVLAIAGRFDAPDGALAPILDVARRAFGAMGAGSRCACAPPAAPAASRRFSVIDTPSSQTDLRLAFRAPGAHDAREPAVEMLLRVLDDGMSTRLYERVCDARGLCYDVSAAYEPYEDDGIVDVAATAQHDRSATVLSTVLEVLDELRQSGPSDAELDKARDRHRWSVEAMADDPESTAEFHGHAMLSSGPETPAERHATLAAVTRDQVREAAGRVFQRDAMSTIAVGSLPRGEGRKLAKALDKF